MGQAAVALNRNVRFPLPLRAADQEPFSLMVLEAMACGLPVVAARPGVGPNVRTESHACS